MKTTKCKKKYCCKDFIHHTEHFCSVHTKFECLDTLIIHLSSHGYGISVKDGGSSIIAINFCPWCGVKIDHKLQKKD